MKNRRTVLLAFLLIACLCIGIGYAYVSKDLKISGTATTAVASIDVEFSAASIKSADSTKGDDAHKTAIQSASSVGAPGDTTISFTAAGLTYIGDSVTAEFTITNYNEYAVDIKSVDAPTLTAFTVNVEEFADGEDGTTVTGTTLTLPAGETETFTVTVTLNDASANKLNETFTVTFNASAGTPVG